MKVGALTNHLEPEMVKGFDMMFYYLKQVDGTIGTPAKGMYNDISCFADAKILREKPEWVAISKNGEATRRNRLFNFRWDHICPTNEEYQSFILNLIRETSGENVKGIVLNLYHFPEEGFCTCERCTKKWRESKLDWIDWRSEIVTDFVRRAKELVKQIFAVELWPDPILAKERFGLDFDALAKYVDFFHVPLSAYDYMTTYWVETLTRDFKKILKKPLYIELGAESRGRTKTKALLKAMAYISRYGVDAILLYANSPRQIEEICEIAVEDVKLRNWLQDYGFKHMTKLVNRWEDDYKV